MHGGEGLVVVGGLYTGWIGTTGMMRGGCVGEREGG